MFSDITDQRTLTKSADITTNDTLETPTDLLDRAQQHAADVATGHFPDLPVEAIDWEVSHRAQRQAGVTKYDPCNRDNHDCTDLDGLRTPRVGAIQFHCPPRTHPRLAVSRVRRRRSRRNIHPLDRCSRHLATPRTLGVRENRP